MGRELTLGSAPGRVVSLVPSETYNLFALGLGDRLVGRTEFCVEPAGAVDGIAVVGGTKNADVEAIAALEPDLILANQEENSKPALLELARRRFRVFVSFPKSVNDAIAHLARLARLFQVEREPEVVELVRLGYALAREPRPSAHARAFVPIWLDPLMTFAAQTYAHDVLAWAGLANIFAGRERRYPLRADLGYAEPLAAGDVEGRDLRYPRITFDELKTAAPDLILLPDEPYPFSAADLDTFAALDLPATIALVSGRDLFWPGAHTIDALPRLRQLLASPSPPPLPAPEKSDGVGAELIAGGGSDRAE